ncbi:amidohydrolase family protein [Steroidobacter sp.]|uniref:amidohydrolase family protein n=1 Tax=Steroidobacter sp. TaxID=1978227 RepID=UPI001A466D47|nr:amidohydrolase family protein [Steroidobacter sp.]MBL8270503.1 amidohydrolase family protein [Steroidobacter sp.]
MRTSWPAIAMTVAATAMLAPATHAATIKAIVGATVVNIDGGAPIENAVVVIDGERITAIGPSSRTQVPAGAEVIQMPGTWLIPGLMNMHVHFGLKLPGKDRAALADETTAELALRMMVNARKSLAAGVTTIRMTGSEGNTGVAIREAIKRGDYAGPRVFTAGGVTMTAGHGSKPGVTYNDGPYEMVKTTRAKISDGQDWIKIAISGGVATDGGGIAEALMTPEEMRAVIDAAHRFGIPVAAHSGSTAATNAAVDAGIDSIEHGYVLDRAVLRKMVKSNTWLVPTIMVTHPGGREYFERIGSPEWYLQRRESVGKQHWETLKAAIQEGVKIALGTDQMPFEPNDGTTSTVREAEAYVEAGMTPLQALRSATIASATMLRAEKEIGSLEVGKYADILAVNGDPLKNISSLRNITMIMKGGTVYRNISADSLASAGP